MRALLIIMFILAVTCVKAKEIKYTGSTPAGPEVRRFLGIPLPDSVDFIRWVLIIDSNKYALGCNYGISKPNTAGFIANGKSIKLTGSFSSNNNYYRFQNKHNYLNIALINRNILQLLDDNKNMLVGNGGWSYTLNSTAAVTTGAINVSPLYKSFKDSMILEGRTPCAIPGLLLEETVCYKLKWHIVMYSNDNNNTGSYVIYSNLWGRQQEKKGTWSIVKNSNNNSFYKLTDSNKQLPVFLVKIDDNIFMFANKEGNLLVGDEDFSYTLNRIAKH